MKLTDLVGKTIKSIHYTGNQSFGPDVDTVIVFTDNTVLIISTSEWITYYINGDMQLNETN